MCSQDRGTGRMPHPAIQADPLQNTHLLGVPALAGNRYASLLIQPRDHTPPQNPTLGSFEGLGNGTGQR